MQVALVILLYAILFIFLFLFVRKTSEIAYKLYDNKKENVQEEINFRLFGFYKYVSYALMMLILVMSIIIAPNIRLIGWIYIFNALWVISLIFVKLNITLIDHLLNVLYVKHALKSVEKELLIGGIIKEKHRFYFSYRLTLDKFYI